MSFTLSPCVSASYLLVLTLCHWLLSRRSSCICLPNGGAFCCLLHCPTRTFQLGLSHLHQSMLGMFPHNEIELCSVLHGRGCTVLACMQRYICLIGTEWKRRTKFALLCGPWGDLRVIFSVWQACYACPELMLWRASSSLGSSSGQVGPGWTDLL